MRYQLKSGAWIEGTQEQINAVRVSLGEFIPDGRHYNSSSRGIVLISNMETTHLRNAIRKMYREWVESLDNTLSNHDFVLRLRSGPNTDITLLGLVAELQRRR